MSSIFPSAAVSFSWVGARPKKNNSNRSDGKFAPLPPIQGVVQSDDVLRIGILVCLYIVEDVVSGKGQIQRESSPDWNIVAQSPTEVAQPGDPVRIQVAAGAIIANIVRDFGHEPAGPLGQEVVLNKRAEQVVAGLVVLPLVHAGSPGENILVGQPEVERGRQAHRDVLLPSGFVVCVADVWVGSPDMGSRSAYGEALAKLAQTLRTAEDGHGYSDNENDDVLHNCIFRSC